jgi:hypothetical protein
VIRLANFSIAVALVFMCFIGLVFLEAVFYQKVFAETNRQPMSIKQSFFLGQSLYSSLLVWSMVTTVFFVLRKILVPFLTTVFLRLVIIIFGAAFSISFVFLVLILVNERIRLGYAMKRSILLGWRNVFSLATIFAEIWLYSILIMIVLIAILLLIGYFSLVDLAYVSHFRIIRIFGILCMFVLLLPAIVSLYQKILQQERHKILDQIPPYMV